MDLIRLRRGDVAYPAALSRYLGEDAPSSVAALGNLEALKANKLALFCSVRCPAKLILQTHDLARAFNRHRGDSEMALYRNRFVTALAERIVVTYTATGGKTEQLCRDIIAWEKPLFTLPSDANSSLIALGARPITSDEAFPLEWR